MRVGSSDNSYTLYELRKKREREFAEKIGLDRKRIDYFTESDTIVLGEKEPTLAEKLKLLRGE